MSGALALGKLGEEQQGWLGRGLEQPGSRLLTLAGQEAASGREENRENEEQMEELNCEEALQLTFQCRRVFLLRSCFMESNNVWKGGAMVG